MRTIYPALEASALKAADPEHLISAGGIHYHEIFEWDPGIVKMDFYSPHFYPEYRGYEIPNGTMHSIPEAMDRINGLLYWIGNNVPHPWLIGETGFAGIPDGTVGNPEVDGNYTQQAA
ncbi:MAG: hypothetical protein NTV09_02790 [Bacteroidetes bacterium]|nr:hypothetical protein [Bacteroidota bacterium]